MDHLLSMEAMVTPEEFWSRVDQPADGCWEWQRARTKAGYGEFMHEGKMWYAHRFAWTLAHGTIPPGVHVLHRCDNPPCCRDDHLFGGAQADNMADMKLKGRARGKISLGEQHGMAKLTDEDVRQIRQMYGKRNQGGLSAPRLAALFGVSHVTIHRIVSGRNWQHVS